ncbi:hypothetical protein FHG87_006079, partial [Trinorchestia longiramus]
SDDQTEPVYAPIHVEAFNRNTDEKGKLYLALELDTREPVDRSSPDSTTSPVVTPTQINPILSVTNLSQPYVNTVPLPVLDFSLSSSVTSPSDKSSSALNGNCTLSTPGSSDDSILNSPFPTSPLDPPRSFAADS